MLKSNLLNYHLKRNIAYCESLKKLLKHDENILNRKAGIFCNSIRGLLNHLFLAETLLIQRIFELNNFNGINNNDLLHLWEKEEVPLKIKYGVEEFVFINSFETSYFLNKNAESFIINFEELTLTNHSKLKEASMMENRKLKYLTTDLKTYSEKDLDILFFHVINHSSYHFGQLSTVISNQNNFNCFANLKREDFNKIANELFTVPDLTYYI